MVKRVVPTSLLRRGNVTITQSGEVFVVDEVRPVTATVRGVPVQATLVKGHNPKTEEGKAQRKVSELVVSSCSRRWNIFN